MALYFYFNETAGDLVYSDKAAYDVAGYVSLGEQTNMNPNESPDWVFHSQRSAIATVSKDESIVGKITGLTSMTNMFAGFTKLTNLNLSGFDTSAVTNMSAMFYACNRLTNLDLSNFDTSAVAYMSSMFEQCSDLTSLDLSGFDTSAATDIAAMFSNCNKLTSLDLSGFDTSSAQDCLKMFNGCRRLRLITISDKMSNALSELPANQYYPAAGGAPVAKADLTAGTWVRDEADLTKVTSLVQQAQMSQAISRRIGGVRRDLEATASDVKELQDSISQRTVNGITANVGGQIVSCSAVYLSAINELWITVPVSSEGNNIQLTASDGIYFGTVVIYAPSGVSFFSSNDASIQALTRNGMMWVLRAVVTTTQLTINTAALSATASQPYTIMVRTRAIVTD